MQSTQLTAYSETRTYKACPKCGAGVAVLTPQTSGGLTGLCQCLCGNIAVPIDREYLHVLYEPRTGLAGPVKE